MKKQTFSQMIAEASILRVGVGLLIGIGVLSILFFAVKQNTDTRSRAEHEMYQIINLQG